MEIVILSVGILSCLLSLTAIFLIFARTREKTADNSALVNEIRASRQETTQSVQSSVVSLGDVLKNSQTLTTEAQDKRLRELNEMIAQQQKTLRDTVGDSLTKLETQFKNLSEQTEKRLTSMQEGNEKKLEEMRQTVDEKLQKTLEERINKSFELVSKNLDEVSKGLGEMKTLASDVGGLKKVLSGVKTRGIMGEIQLGAILGEILSPDQYELNIATVPNSQNRVEFAVKLPGNDDGAVYLPIDSKFPLDAYTQLNDAYDSGDTEAIKLCSKALEQRIKSFAKDIHDKYIEPPHTTDFAIMFLPVESLYAEVVRSGLVEPLQRDYKINIAGPTTMAAMLNSLRMGFNTLAIQKRSGEVWNLLSAVKTEFGKFSDCLDATQRKLRATNDELDKLVGTRTRAINRSLKAVATISAAQSEQILLVADPMEE